MRGTACRPLLLVPFLAGCASSPDLPRSGMIVGYHGLTEHYAEAGVVVYNPQVLRHGVPGSSGFSASSELHMNDRFIMGVTGSTWFSFVFLELGLNGTIYTDFTGATIRLRPELGVDGVSIGPTLTRFVWGINIPLYNKDFEGVSLTEFAVRTVVPF